MRRFRLLFVVFALALLVPVGVLVQRALHSMTLEQQLHHQAIAERAFDEMEGGLSRLLEREQQRPFEQYIGNAPPPEYPFVVGYFQIDPDGSIHAASAQPHETATAEIEQVLGSYWRTGHAGAEAPKAAPAQRPGSTLNFLQATGPLPLAPEPDVRRDDTSDGAAGSAFDVLRSLNKEAQERSDRQRKLALSADLADATVAPLGDERRALMAAPPAAVRGLGSRNAVVAPIVGRIIDPHHLILYRTVVRDTRGYRQGLLLAVGRLGIWLQAQALANDGLAPYASASFATPFASPPSVSDDPTSFLYQHRFAEPFDDLTARLTLRPLPGVGGVTYVYALAALLMATAVLGLAALYRMVSVVISFAERRNNFVAAVSHELKTPLTAIRMYGEMPRDGMVASDAKRAEYYRHITVESERLSRLINNVLELSRLEKGTRDMAMAPGPIAPVVQDVAELLRPHVEAAGFHLCLEIDADLPPARFERDALVQVLCNLVDNAVKYAGSAARGEIRLRCWRRDQGVSVAVRDHGPGVPSRHLARLFEPFYRGESELTRRSKGTGIGLALVRGLVERMGARVSGRNVADGGFEVEIAFDPVT